MKLNLTKLSALCVITLSIASANASDNLSVKFGDPFVLAASDGKYYMYGTSLGDGFEAYSSTDLQNWEPCGQIYKGGAPEQWNLDCFWAPEVYERDGKYYLFYSANAKENPTNEVENFKIGVAVADSPTGPFRDLYNRPIFNPPYPIIDANVLFDDASGKTYLYYSRCCYKHPVESEIAAKMREEKKFDEIEESWVYGVELAPDFSGIIGEPQLLLQPPTYLDDRQAEWESRSVTSGEVNRRWTEGSYIFKEGDTYYIMYSANFYAGPHYAVGYATSKYPLGPFTKAANNPVLQENVSRGGNVTGTGHNMMFVNPADNLKYTVYHGYMSTNPTERVVFIDKLNIDPETGILSVDDDLLTLSGLDPNNFRTVVDGMKTDLYVLKNGAGMEACITNYGGRLVSLMVPDKNGRLIDVVLGHDSIADYRDAGNNFGALIGRYGNRIKQGRFTLNGTTYQLPQNNYGHCLHGGPKGFHHSVWDADQPNDTTLVLSLSSPDGEAGFPGNINVTVTYTLTTDNALAIDYKATTDKPTILNLTNHSYFNLSGNPANDILGEMLMVNANGFTPIDDTFMTTGEILPVEGTPFDFRIAKAVGRDIATDNEQLKNGLGYDHNFVLATNGDINVPAASVVDPTSGVEMEVFTNEPGIQLYVGNFLDGNVKGKRGIAYPRRGAICLETQHYPDSPNKPQWPSVVVTPGEEYTSSCIYRFSTQP